MEKSIGNISREKWMEAFKNAVNIAIDKDYFSDIIYFDLFPDANDETPVWDYVSQAMNEYLK